jgi:hypothetical protein
MRRFLPRPSLGDRPYRSLEMLWPRLFMAVATALLAMVWLRVAFGHDDRLLGSALAATVAAASLVYSLARGQAAARDQYTLSLIAKRFDDGDYAANVRAAGDLRRQGTITPESGLAILNSTSWADPFDPDNRMRAAYAIIPILNYWEHVCTAYVDDRINRRIFEDLVQDLIRELVGRYPAIIGDMRTEDETNLEHLCAVWWVIASPTERRQLARRLGPVPRRLCNDDQSRWTRAAA